jgi:hypothetical protein
MGQRQHGHGGQWQAPDRGYDHPGPGPRYQGHGYEQPFPRQQPPFALPPQQWQRKQSWPLRHKALASLFAFIGLLIIIVAASSAGSPSSPSSAGGHTTAGTQPHAAASTALANASGPAAVPTLTYEVIGSSAADVTYGPAGSTLSGAIPMKVNAKLGNALYYSLTAQLQGGGSVTVKILINGKAISQSNATGGYNIATAEISQDPLTGEWTDTNSPG